MQLQATSARGSPKVESSQSKTASTSFFSGWKSRLSSLNKPQKEWRDGAKMDRQGRTLCLAFSIYSSGPSAPLEPELQELWPFPPPPLPSGSAGLSQWGPQQEIGRGQLHSSTEGHSLVR